MSLDEKTDEELVELFKSGNAAAFDAIVQRFQDRIFRLAGVWLYDEQFAADAAQEVFIRSFRGLRRFRFRSTPFTWLYRTTRNVCHEFNRRRRTETLVDEPVDGDAAPETLVAEFETAARVRRLVAGLPERQQAAVILRLFEEMSVRDTAKAMGCREGTVKALLHKAITKLRTQVELKGIGYE